MTIAAKGPPPGLAAESGHTRVTPGLGQVPVSESERARAWCLRLKPDERLGLPRHVPDCVWTALSRGRAQSHLNGGPASEAEPHPRQTERITFGPGEFMVHDLENVGDTELIFATVEPRESASAASARPEGDVPPDSLPAWPAR